MHWRTTTMKKIVLILRDGFDAKYICSNLAGVESKFKLEIIYESGKLARRKKIKRMLRDKKNVFQAFLNMGMLIIYDKIMLSKITQKCKVKEEPILFDSYYIDDVNDPECLKICRDISPDLILIYGTGILKAETIENLGADIYNIHSSILPYYRNVHSDFWAYMNKEYDKIGITIFKLDTGIDSGSIAKQIVCELPDSSKLYEYKSKNLENIVKIIPDFIDGYFKGRIVLTDQNLEEGSVSYTPGSADIIKLFKREMKK